MKMLHLKCLIWKKKPCCIHFSSVIGFPAGLHMRTSHRWWTCLCFCCCFLKRIIFPFLFLYQLTSRLGCKRNKNCNTSFNFCALLSSNLLPVTGINSLQVQLRYWRGSRFTIHPWPSYPTRRMENPNTILCLSVPQLKKTLLCKCTYIYRAAWGFWGRCLASAFQSTWNSFVASLLISEINYRATLNFSHLHLILEPGRKTVPYF